MGVLVALAVGLGALLIFGGANKKGSEPTKVNIAGIPPAGSVWQFLYRLNRPLTDAEWRAVQAVFASTWNTPLSGTTVVTASLHDTNMVVVSRFDVQPEYPIVTGVPLTLPGLVPTVTATLDSVTPAPISA